MCDVVVISFLGRVSYIEVSGGVQVHRQARWHIVGLIWTFFFFAVVSSTW